MKRVPAGLVDGLHVEAHRVRHVENLPTELQALVSGPRHFQCLARPKVDAKETGPTESVPCTRLFLSPLFALTEVRH